MLRRLSAVAIYGGYWVLWGSGAFAGPVLPIVFLLAIVVPSFAFGAFLGTWWSVWMAFIPTLLSVSAPSADGIAAWVWALVVVTTPALIAIAIGVATRRSFGRASLRGRAERRGSSSAG